MKWQCALLQRWLPEYPDGDLPAFWRGRLTGHLARCSACRAELSTLKEVVAAVHAAPVADPGPEFWGDFSRQMHLKLVRAAQEGKMAPAPSAWWGRLPYLVGAPALAALILWIGIAYLNPERPGLTPPAPMAKQESVKEQNLAATPPAPMAEREGVQGKMAAAPPAPVEVPQASPGVVYVSKNGKSGGEEMAPDDDLDDLDSTLAGMTPVEKEAFLKKLSQHEKDGSCITRFSATFLA